MDRDRQRHRPGDPEAQGSADVCLNRIGLPLRKHGVYFEEAATVFADDNARLKHDPEHSNGEDRFILLGLSDQLRMLVVCHTYREADWVIRLISARKATRKESEQYGSFL